jgi:phage/plasmid-associated DNA primase
MDSADWWEQSGELPGIFNWALQGLWRLRMQKQFTASELVTDAIQDYQDESNPVRTYLRENFEPGRGIVKSKDAYRFYVDWALETGHKPMNERTFGKEFQRMFPGSPRKYGGSRSSRYYYYDEIHFSQDEICGKPTPKNNLLEEGFDE